ncbi:MAG: DUF4911 domain-containing protein [Thermodesulfobacteria bacterium]|nr:DUF4911 domain-containing protein [Thermodesulfobacteriota bacterium]
MSIKTLNLKITPSKVFLLRFILEGYDNMFVLTTVDKQSGVVEIQYCESAYDQLCTILDEIGNEIGLEKSWP